MIEDDKWDLNIPSPPPQIQYLFPLPLQSGWTTSISSERPSHIVRISLSDSELGVNHISSGTTHNICTLSDNAVKVWEAVYPKGSYKPSGETRGGFGFYLEGPAEGEWRTKLANASEVVFGYAVRFEKEFDFVKGGKLPGVCASCTTFGVVHEVLHARFPLRVSWRRG